MRENTPEKLYIDPVPMPPKETLREIRSSQTYRLLGYFCEQGVLLYDRYAHTNNLLTWDELQAQFVMSHKSASNTELDNL